MLHRNIAIDNIYELCDIPRVGLKNINIKQENIYGTIK